jgi:hypothetical protein
MIGFFDNVLCFLTFSNVYIGIKFHYFKCLYILINAQPIISLHLINTFQLLTEKYLF